MFAKLTSGIFSGMKKFLTMERVVVLIVFLILMWALVMYANNKTIVLDKMEGGVEEKKEGEEEKKVEEPVANQSLS